MNIRIYSDGACEGNGKEKNIGSFGFVIVDAKDNILYEHAEIEKNTTNNRMELRAIIKAMDILKIMDYQTCTIYSDSKYCVEGINNWMYSWENRGWKEVKNSDLWKTLFFQIKSSKRVTVKWIKGHQNKNTWNDYIDQKIVSLRTNKQCMEETNRIDVEIVSSPGVEVLEVKEGYIELLKNRIKIVHNFTIEVEYENDDEMLPSDYEKEKIDHTVISDKSALSSISVDRNEEHSRYELMISFSSDIHVLSFKSKKKALEVMEKIEKWRWN